MPKRLKDYLDDNNIKYVKISHSPAYTAQEIAASIHIPGKELAKTVILKVNEGFAMAVLPASRKINFDTLKEVVGDHGARLANEDEFKDIFPDCEVGAMPPFGNLYELPVYVATALSEDKEIAFNAGTHTDIIKTSYSDFEKLVKPIVSTFSEE
ncbi:YbaK/EbsC family protein [Desulfobacterota bacterium AH_259_B03_O07]|nr:YbaK/EbsC family protein [Desulfobacterota bacterium AH_259_B03_O07]